MIHICYGLYDKYGNYSKFVGTSMISIFLNTKSEVTVHILHDNTLSAENINKFETVAKNYNQQVKFYNVEVLQAEKISEFRKRLGRIIDTNFSIGTLYRLLIPRVLSDLKKIIYLDADIIVNLDINELWNVDISEKPLAATAEKDIILNYESIGMENFLMQKGLVSTQDYFNAGVLILNLPKFLECKTELNAAIEFVIAHPQCTWFDQDILNYCFSKNYFRLPAKFDIFVNHERIVKRCNEIFPAVYHYIGDSLNFDMSDNFNRLWMKYFFKTPWLNLDVIGRIYKCFQDFDAQSQKKLIEISAAISGKRRIFFIELNNFELIKQIFKISKSEEIIDATKPDSVKILLKRLKKFRGIGFFILLVRDYQTLRENLSAAGFVEGTDFIDAMEFLSVEHGKEPVDTYFLARAI